MLHRTGERVCYKYLRKSRFMNILQNLHFTDNQKADRSDKAYKMRIVINYVNKAFQDAMSDAERQSIDEHMTKFKGRMSCKQYMKNKPIKCDFKRWCRCCSKTGYLHEFDLYLGKKEKTKLGLGETVVLDLSEKLENNTVCFILTIFLILQHWLRSFSIEEYTALVQFEMTGKIWLL